MRTHTYIYIKVSPHTGAVNTHAHTLPHVLNHYFLFFASMQKWSPFGRDVTDEVTA